MPDHEEEFDLQAELQKLKTDPRRHINLIGEYLEARGVDIRNKKQLHVAIHRHVRSAAELAAFDDDQIAAANREAQEWGIPYNLGSLVKILTR